MNSKNLAELQSIIQNAIQTQTLPNSVHNLVLEKPPISTLKRIKIYQDAYLIRLTESLRDDFSRVEEKLPQDIFENIVHNFIMTTPSRSKNLAEYSETFPNYIKTNYPELFRPAMMDWMEILSSHAAEPKRKISIDEINSGKSFKVRTHPATIAQEIDGKLFLAYRREKDVQFYVTNESEERLFHFLEHERSIDDLTKIVDQNFPETMLMTTITKWIKESIIFCEGDQK